MVFLLISLWVNNQLSYDKSHIHNNEIYRLELPGSSSVRVEHSLAVGLFIKEKIAEVNEIVRIRRLNLATTLLYSASNNMNLTDEISLENSYYADSTFFSIFTFQFIYGDAKKALKEPNSIVIIESLAKKMFLDENPMGRKVNMDGNLCTITGVIKDFNNFHIPVEAIGTLSIQKETYKNVNVEWDSWRFPLHPT